MAVGDTRTPGAELDLGRHYPSWPSEKKTTESLFGKQIAPLQTSAGGHLPIYYVPPIGIPLFRESLEIARFFGDNTLDTYSAASNQS